MKHLFTTALIATAVTSSIAYAEDAKKSLKTDLEFGLIATSGNTESSSYTGKLDITQDLKKFKNHLVIEGLYKKDEVDSTVDGETTTEDQTTAQKYFVSGQTDYKLNEEHKGLFVYASYEDDRFSGFAYQGTFAVGYSDRLFQTDSTFLDYSIGPGVVFNKLEDTEEAEGESTTTAAVRFSAAYEYTISETAKFTQTLSADAAAESGKNTKSKSVTALTANLNSALALKASFTVNHNTHVPEEKKHADTQTAITLVYSF